MATLLYQGHGSYRITTNDGRVIYVDPWAGGGYDVPADIIVVTHEHFDHTAIDKMPHAEGYTVYRSCDLHPSVEEYLSVSCCGVTLTAVPAENVNHPVAECMGVVIGVDGVTVYASGDTSTTSAMRDGTLAAMNLTYALLPGDGVFNMDVAEASTCASLIGAKHTIPVHLLPVNTPEDATNPAVIFSRDKAEAFQAPGKIVMEPGKTITLA